MKQWDCIRERIEGAGSTASTHKHQPQADRKRDRGHSGAMSDPYNRPEKKILLLHGPPGLGKTTLAHVVARATGYAVVEINASDERTGNTVINKISSAIQVQSCFDSEKRPNLVIIDEIDGAAAAGNEQVIASDQKAEYIFRI